MTSVNDVAVLFSGILRLCGTRKQLVFGRYNKPCARFKAKNQKQILLNSFHLNTHTLGFHPQTQEVAMISSFSA